MNWLLDLLRLPGRIWMDIVGVLRDPHARLVAVWFLVILCLVLGLGYMYAINSGLGFFGSSCAAYFSEERILALLMLSPFAVFIALSSVGEAIQWMEARRRGKPFRTHFFWRFAGLGAVMLVTAYLLGSC